MRKYIPFLCLCTVIWVLILGCLPTTENTVIITSDGITSSGQSTDPEILPNATVTMIPNKGGASLLSLLFARPVEGLDVQFYAKDWDAAEDAWVALGSPLATDENGRAALPETPGLRGYFSGKTPPIDLQLRARVYFEDGSQLSDDNGLIRILDGSTENNPAVLFTDHDNTLHATGGTNTLSDWMDAFSWAEEDLPLVDVYAADAVKALNDNGKDIVVVSGIPAQVRALCRQQINRHFESGGRRFIPVVIREDLAVDQVGLFKKAAIQILNQLYGAENCMAMVGDTADVDGYAALSNGVLYVPFNIKHRFNPSLLDTGGFGDVDPDTIAWHWLDVVSGLFLPDADPASNYFLGSDTGFLNIAHRGGGDLRPENTIQAYLHALAAGSESLEGDLHATSDGVVVVSHDKTVDRCTDGTGYIKEKTLSEIKSLDAGYQFTPDGGASFPYRGAGHEIPTLIEVFGHPDLDQAPMVVEIKQAEPSIVDDVLDIIDDYGMADRIILGSFNLDSLNEVRVRAAVRGLPIVTSFALDEVMDYFFTPLSVVRAGGYRPVGRVLQVPTHYNLGGLNVQVINKTFMQKAWILGLKVQAWTINRPDDMRWLMNDMNVDGIMTDNPELLESIIME